MSGEGPNAQRAYTAKRLWLSAAAFTIGGLVLLHYRFFLFNLIGAWAVSTFNLLIEVVLFLNVIRPGEVLVWIGPAGIGQQSVFDPRSKLPRLRWFNVLFCVLSAAGFTFYFRDTLNKFFIVACSFLLAVTLLASTYQAFRRTTFTVEPDGIRPGILAWDVFVSIRWRGLGDGRYELWTRKSPRVRATDITHVLVDLTPEQAAAFEQLLIEWTNGSADTPLRARLTTGKSD